MEYCWSADKYRPLLFLAQFFLRVGVKGNIVDQVISDHNASAADTSSFLMAIDGKQGVDDAANHKLD